MVGTLSGLSWNSTCCRLGGLRSADGRGDGRALDGVPWGAILCAFFVSLWDMFGSVFTLGKYSKGVWG